VYGVRINLGGEIAESSSVCIGNVNKQNGSVLSQGRSDQSRNPCSESQLVFLFLCPVSWLAVNCINLGSHKLVFEN